MLCKVIQYIRILFNTIVLQRTQLRLAQSILRSWRKNSSGTSRVQRTHVRKLLRRTPRMIVPVVIHPMFLVSGWEHLGICIPNQEDEVPKRPLTRPGAKWSLSGQPRASYAGEIGGSNRISKTPTCLFCYTTITGSLWSFTGEVGCGHSRSSLSVWAVHLSYSQN